MSKTTDPKVEVVEVVQPEKQKRWNVGSVFWGLLLIMIGVLFLLDNLDVVTVNFNNVWQLWPVFIIGAGLSLLSLKGWFGALVSFVAAIAVLGLVAFAVVDNPWYSSLQGNTATTQTQSVSLEGAKKIDATIDAGAATITFNSSDTEKGVTVTQDSTNLTLEKAAETKGDTRHVTFNSTSPKGFWLNGSSNTLNAVITRNVPAVLNVKTGATTVKGDLSGVRLAKLTIDAGASSVDLRLGAREARQEVDIDAGASKVVLSIPNSVGVRVESQGGLSSTDFEGIEKRSDDVYESNDFSTFEKQIIIRADMGVSKFEIKRY